MVAVRILRQLLRVSRADFATVAGVSVRELVRVENGEVVPGKTTAASIDAAFKTLIIERMREESGD